MLQKILQKTQILFHNRFRDISKLIIWGDLMNSISTLQYKLVSTPNQLKLVHVMAEQIWHEYYTNIIGREQVVYLLQKYQTVKALEDQVSQGYRYELVLHDSTPIGYISTLQNLDHLYISKLYLIKEARKKGFARQMMTYIENQAKQLSLSQIQLNVNKHNHHTIEVYKHFGFSIIKEVKIDIGSGFYLDDYVMAKSI